MGPLKKNETKENQHLNKKILNPLMFYKSMLDIDPGPAHRKIRLIIWVIVLLFLGERFVFPVDSLSLSAPLSFLSLFQYLIK